MQGRPAARKRDFSMALICALAVHAVLLTGLFIAFQWKTHNEEVYAELWASVPSTGEAENGAPEKTPEPDSQKAPPPPEAPAPQPQAQPQPPEPPKPDPEQVRKAEAEKAEAEKEAARKAEILAAQEKAKKQEEEKRRQQRLAEEERQRQAEEKRRLAEQEAEKKRIAREMAEKKRVQEEKLREAEARRLAEEARKRAMVSVRERELARVAGGKPSQTQAGVPTGDRTARFQNLSGAARASFIARVTACIRPHIIFDVPAGVKRGQYTAGYRVRLMPTGDQLGAPAKTKSSGLPGYDAAVERAIAKCPRFPTVPGVVMPGEVSLTFDPVDVR